MREVRLPEFMLRAFLRGLGAPRRIKQAVMLGIDLLGMALCFLLAAYWVKDWWPPYPPGLWLTLVATVAGGMLGLILSGIYQSYLRYWGGGTLARAAIGGVGAGLSGYLFAQGFYPEVLGAGFFLLSAGLVVLAISVARATLSSLLRASVESSAEPVVIYGAGAAGQQVLSIIRASHEYRPVCFVDDNAKLWGQSINGLKVERPDSLSSWLPGTGFRRIILAIPSVKSDRRRSIIEQVKALGVHIVSIPPLDDVLSGRQRLDQFLELDVNDLLARDSVAPVPQLFQRCVAGRTVMVTGAGGSIGSEICRQCVTAGAARLVLFELSESALYHIERELRALPAIASGALSVVPILGDVCDYPAVESAISALQVETVYHAAAYKHVPLVEANIVSGVRNNIFGTQTVIEASIAGQVKDLVLVSTDKAVKPTNVMGATKRGAELVVQAYAAQSAKTCLSMVRFGNVLASSGSVVPLFREQVRTGGPVTVTHPEITRYFMTIPEAAQLVLQASGLARGGEVFLLDMGDSVRIRDLAVRVIELMGKSVRDERYPDGDIEIRYTDLRPGEKLYEELLIDSTAEETEHPKIRRALEPILALNELNGLLTELRAACETLDAGAARQVLVRLVPEYSPAARNHDWRLSAVEESPPLKLNPLSQAHSE